MPNIARLYLFSPSWSGTNALDEDLYDGPDGRRDQLWTATTDDIWTNVKLSSMYLVIYCPWYTIFSVQYQHSYTQTHHSPHLHDHHLYHHHNSHNNLCQLFWYCCLFVGKNKVCVDSTSQHSTLIFRSKSSAEKQRLDGTALDVRLLYAMPPPAPHPHALGSLSIF